MGRTPSSRFREFVKRDLKIAFAVRHLAAAVIGTALGSIVVRLVSGDWPSLGLLVGGGLGLISGALLGLPFARKRAIQRHHDRWREEEAAEEL